MNEKNTQYLLETYPVLYQDFYESYKNTAMCWGFECGDGWFELIKNLSQELYDYCERVNTELPIVTQVKEKFGSLRYYINSGTTEMYDIINKFCDQSTEICEVTGEPGKLRLDNGWYRVLCDEEAAKIGAIEVKNGWANNDDA